MCMHMCTHAGRQRARKCRACARIVLGACVCTGVCAHLHAGLSACRYTRRYRVARLRLRGEECRARQHDVCVLSRQAITGGIKTGRTSPSGQRQTFGRAIVEFVSSAVHFGASRQSPGKQTSDGAGVTGHQTSRPAPSAQSAIFSRSSVAPRTWITGLSGIVKLKSFTRSSAADNELVY